MNDRREQNPAYEPASTLFLLTLADLGRNAPFPLDIVMPITVFGLTL